MSANTNHTIKIQVWTDGVLELIEIQRVFPTFISARVYAQEYADKSRHPKFKLKIYNFLAQTVFTIEEEATPDPVEYA